MALQPPDRMPSELAALWLDYLRQSMKRLAPSASVPLTPTIFVPASEVIQALDYLIGCLNSVETPRTDTDVVVREYVQDLNKRLNAHERAIAKLQKLHDFTDETNYGHDNE